VIYRSQIEAADKPEELRKRKIKEFDKKFNHLFHAGGRQLFQDIIDPRSTRSLLIKALDWFTNKKEEDRPFKKHGNIPI
jgi:acetyl-CoA carboxylase carboxyltransferase component